MKTKFSMAAGLAGMIFLAGCATPLPPGAEPGPNHTMAYDVLVEASSPGVQIEANGEPVGQAPVHLKIFGDPDGTFHDFGSDYYEIRALPAAGATNQYVQTRLYQTGRWLSPQDRIPDRIYFNMNEPPPRYVPYPVYVTPPPPAFYDPFYYDRYYYYGPSFRFHFGAPLHHPRSRHFHH